jgi:hypothetical protein
MRKATGYERRLHQRGQASEGRRRIALAAYWTVTVSDPLAHVLPLVIEALTVEFPVARRLAAPEVVVENVSTDVLLEVQVAELVTSVPFSVAVNCTAGVVARVNGPVGPIVKVCPPDPVTLPVAEPLTPDTVAVMVTLDTAATPFTVPDITVAQGVELCQVAELVTSFDPLEKLAVAKSFTVEPCATVKVLEPVPFTPVVTERELGWFTKKPVHPAPTPTNRTAAALATSAKFLLELDIIANP